MALTRSVRTADAAGKLARKSLLTSRISGSYQLTDCVCDSYPIVRLPLFLKRSKHL